MRWLSKHGIRVEQLVMGPWQSAAERRRNYSAAEHKGRAYAASKCSLFIESDDGQAAAIFAATGRPVLCPATGRIHQ